LSRRQLDAGSRRPYRHGFPAEHPYPVAEPGQPGTQAELGRDVPTTVPCHDQELPGTTHRAGRTFWLRLNRFEGSYSRFSRASRS
jgi:hypothetical protein